MKNTDTDGLVFLLISSSTRPWCFRLEEQLSLPVGSTFRYTSLHLLLGPQELISVTFAATQAGWTGWARSHAAPGGHPGGAQVQALRPARRLRGGQDVRPVRRAGLPGSLPHHQATRGRAGPREPGDDDLHPRGRGRPRPQVRRGVRPGVLHPGRGAVRHRRAARAQLLPPAQRGAPKARPAAAAAPGWVPVLFPVSAAGPAKGA